MEAETSRRRYSRSSEETGDRKRRDRSPSSENENDDRRRRRYSGTDETNSRDRSSKSCQDSNSNKNSRRRRRDDRDDRDARRREHHRKDRRDRSRDDLEGGSKSFRHERDRSFRDRSRSRDRREQRPHRRSKRSRSPAQQQRKSASTSPPPRKSRAPLPSQDESFWGEVSPGEAPPPEKQKPNFKPTGLLAKEANTVVGTTTVLKYHEPPEARKPSSKDQWRMYVFKKKDLLETIQLYTRSVWLMGRDEKVADLFLEHPSISKQHAVIQFRYRTTTNEYGDKMSKVKPYLIDLESANGTKLNGKKVETSRYLELVDGDVIAFGESEREYVMMLPSDK